MSSYRVRFLVIALLACMTAAGGTAHAFSGQIAPIETKDLNGKVLSFPGDIGADQALCVIAFEREQQVEVDRVFALIAKTDERIRSMPLWELPVIENPGAIARWFIDTGMRNGVKGTERRSRVATLYVESRQAWMKAAGIPTTKQAYLAVVTRDGAVRAMAPQADLKTESDVAALVAKAGK